MPEQEIKIKFTGDAGQLRLTVDELRAQLGSDFDKVISQAKIGNAALVENLTTAAEQAKKSIQTEALASTEIFKTLEAGRQEYVSSTIKASEQAATSIVSNYVTAGRSAQKEVDSLLGDFQQSQKYAADVAKGATQVLISESEKAIANAERVATAAAGDVEKATSKIATGTAEASSLTGQLGGFASALGPAALGIGVIGAAGLAAAAGLFELVKSSTDATAHLEDLSQRINFSVETISTLKNTAELTGGSIDTVSTSLAIFNKNLGASDDGAKKQQATLAKLNITTGDQEQALRQTFKALYDLTGSYKQNEYAQQLFGKASRDVLAIIKETHGDLDKATEKYRELGTLVGGEDAEAAKKFRNELVQLEQESEALERKLVRELLPGMVEGLNQANGALERHQHLFSTLASAAGAFFEAETREAEGALGMIEQQIAPLETIARLLSTIAKTSPAAGAGAALLQGTLSPPHLGGTPYDQEKADKTYDASQFAAAGAFIEEQEQANKKAEAERERAIKKAGEQLERLKKFAQDWAFAITSTTGGKHNVGSAHYQGRAIDVSVRDKSLAEIDAFIKSAREQGYKVLDEQSRLPNEKVWSGPHIHLEILNKAAQAVNKTLEDQTKIVTTLAGSTAELDIRIKDFAASEATQTIDAERASEGIDKLSGKLRLQAEAELAVKKAKLDSLDALQKNSDIQKSALDLLAAQARARGEEESPIEKVNKLLEDSKANVETLSLMFGNNLPASVRAGIDPAIERLLKLNALLSSFNEELEKSGALSPKGVDLPQIKQPGPGYGKSGPWVDPKEFEKEFGKPPDFSKHIDAIKTFTDYAKSAFEGVAQGFESMLEGWLAGGPAAQESFGAMARGVAAGIAAQAGIQALFELAQALAMTALTYFTGNPKFAASAGAHYAAAATFGIVAGAAGAAALALPKPTSAGGAFASNGAGGSASSSPTPNNQSFNYNSQPTSSGIPGVGNNGVGGMVNTLIDEFRQQRAEQARFNQMQMTINARTEQTFSRIQGIPHGQAVQLGLEENPHSAMTAVITAHGEDPTRLPEKILKPMGF